MTDSRRETIARVVAYPFMYGPPSTDFDAWTAEQLRDFTYEIADRLLASGYCTPPGMTAEKLREIADWADTLDKVGAAYIDMLDGLARRGVETHTSPTDRLVARTTLSGTELQHDLRVWADLLTPTDPDAKRP